MKSLLISFLFILFYITSSLSQDYSEIGKYYPTNYKWLRLEDISYDGLKVGYTTYFRKSGNSIWINDTLIANNYIKYINYFLRFNFSLNKVIYKGLVESEDKWALFSNNNRISRPFLKAINLEYYSYSF